MKAIGITKFGGTEVIESLSVEKTEPSDGEILVKVFACGLNPVDYKIRKGGLPLPFDFPLVLGYDVSGEVAAVGPGVTDFEVGDEVYYSAELLGGALSEFHTVSEDIVALKPSGLLHAEAASVPLAGLTAWQALFDRACIKPGEVVLIHGGAGGVGSLAVQLACWIGCEVIATAGPDNLELVEELGADLVVDYQSGDFVEASLEATSGDGVDAVFDTVGGEVFLKSFQALMPHGRLVSIVPENLEGHALDALSPAFFKNAEVHFHFMERERPALDAMGRLLERGFMEPVVNEVLPFDRTEVIKAHERMATGHARGKLVIAVEKE